MKFKVCTRKMTTNLNFTPKSLYHYVCSQNELDPPLNQHKGFDLCKKVSYFFIFPYHETLSSEYNKRVMPGTPKGTATYNQN